MGERSTILFINLLKIVSLLCERLILKLYSAKYWSMLNSDTQEYIPRNLRQQYPSSHFKEASYSSQSKSVLKRSVNSKRLCPLNNSITHSFSERKYMKLFRHLNYLLYSFIYI